MVHFSFLVKCDNTLKCKISWIASITVTWDNCFELLAEVFSRDGMSLLPSCHNLCPSTFDCWWLGRFQNKMEQLKALGERQVALAFSLLPKVPNKLGNCICLLVVMTLYICDIPSLLKGTYYLPIDYGHIYLN